MDTQLRFEESFSKVESTRLLEIAGKSELREMEEEVLGREYRM